MRTFVRQASGICPKSGKRQTIAITFGEITMAGNPKPGYIPQNLDCEFGRTYGCDLGRECPLVFAEMISLN